MNYDLFDILEFMGDDIDKTVTVKNGGELSKGHYQHNNSMDGSLTILFMADSTMAIMENVKNVVAPNKLVELALYYPKALFNFDFLQISKCINSLFLIMEKHYLRLVIHKLHHQKEKKVFFFFVNSWQKFGIYACITQVFYYKMNNMKNIYEIQTIKPDTSLLKKNLKGKINLSPI